LQPQLAAEYPVEQISQALQGLSITSSASESLRDLFDRVFGGELRLQCRKQGVEGEGDCRDDLSVSPSSMVMQKG
jgi:hypothetical protein